MNKLHFCRNFFLIDWHHKRLKNTVDLLLFYGEYFYGCLESDLGKEKRNIHFITNISIYTGSQTFWSFMSVWYILSLKDSYYAYIPLYMNWILPTSGNEKEQQQIKFYEKLLDELIFSRVTIHLKNFYFTSPTGQVLKK